MKGKECDLFEFCVMNPQLGAVVCDVADDWACDFDFVLCMCWQCCD